MKRLPDTEFTVMKGVWSFEDTVSTAELKEQLERERPWNMSALQTIFSRLEEKGFVVSEKIGRNRFYKAVISEREYLADESRSFFSRLGRKKLSEFAAALWDSGDITESDIEELELFIKEKRGEK